MDNIIYNLFSEIISFSGNMTVFIEMIGEICRSYEFEVWPVIKSVARSKLSRSFKVLVVDIMTYVCMGIIIKSPDCK